MNTLIHQLLSSTVVVRDQCRIIGSTIGPSTNLLTSQNEASLANMEAKETIGPKSTCLQTKNYQRA